MCAVVERWEGRGADAKAQESSRTPRHFKPKSGFLFQHPPRHATFPAVGGNLLILAAPRISATRFCFFGFACRGGVADGFRPMKIRLFSFAALAALVLAGCAKSESTAAGNTAAATPAAAPAAGPRVIQINAGVGDAMKFDVATIEAKAGEDLKIVFTNAGTLPKEAMGHNFVLLKAGSDAAAFATAAMVAKDTDYIPAALKDQIIVHTATLGPKKTEELVFKAPAAGEYPFLCSFPAHFLVGMKGSLIVK